MEGSGCVERGAQRLKRRRVGLRVAPQRPDVGDQPIDALGGRARLGRRNVGPRLPHLVERPLVARARSLAAPNADRHVQGVEHPAQLAPLAGHPLDDPPLELGGPGRRADADQPPSGRGCATARSGSPGLTAPDSGACSSQRARPGVPHAERVERPRRRRDAHGGVAFGHARRPRPCGPRAEIGVVNGRAGGHLGPRGAQERRNPVRGPAWFGRLRGRAMRGRGRNRDECERRRCRR